MAEIVMPRLSDTMEEGTILRWLKADGEQVARGEELVEIETDKATMTYESDQAGVVSIVAPEGATLAVGELIAHVGDAEASAAAGADGARLRASPLARRIAREGGIDLSAVAGSGPGGRIVKADLTARAAVAQPAGAPREAGSTQPTLGAPQQPASAPAAPPHPEAHTPEGTDGLEGVATAKGRTTDVELSRTQQTIARRMAESKATIPDFQLSLDVDMEACVALRAELKRLARGDDAAAHVGTAGVDTGAGQSLKTPTYNDMVVKASALALREHPRANASYRDGRLLAHSRVNVGVAVAVDSALVVPTVFDADEKSLGEIARETQTLAERVRAGTITPPELGGGTFTVSNLGMYGIRSFAAIINPPQAAILSVGSVEQRAVVSDTPQGGTGGAVVARHTMTLTLVSDHRVLYGAEAAGLLARVRELLQTPSALTL